MSEIPTNRTDFERQLDVLRKQAPNNDNPGSYKSTGCVSCFDCMFTTDSEQCYQCTYCSNCKTSTNCTHCKSCTDCHHCNYSVRSERLTGCSYVILSRDCYDSVFLFGCVGLVKKEFHILNQPFRRDEYFRIVKDLKTTFGI